MVKKILISFCLSAVALVATAQNEPYRNPDLSPSERAWDLLKRMTLEEKISQMKNGSPAIERLGIPAYDWWNEALHGVARAGKATVFPQAIGLAATFDNQAVHETFSIVSDEARAKYHDFQRKGERDGYKGLTFWTPNINIYRDPRWGRGMETYGEDPYLTSLMGLAVVKGLQGMAPENMTRHMLAPSTMPCTVARNGTGIVLMPRIFPSAIYGKPTCPLLKLW